MGEGCLRAGGRVPASESACGQGAVPAADSACGQGPCSRVRVCLRAGTSDRCAPPVLSLPPLRGRPLPFTKPRAATPSEVPAHPAFPGRGTMLQPLGWRDCLVLASWLHRFASLGLKSRIDARFCQRSAPRLHRFASLGLKSRIDARIALVLASWLHRFASLGLKSRIDARFALVLASWLHRFASLGLNSRIDARFLPRMAPRLQRFASLGLKSRIDAAPSCRQSRTVPPAAVVVATAPRPTPIFFVAK